MPPTRDPAAIRAALETDRAWAVYALGDLAPHLFADTEWRVATEPPAVVMLYRGFDTPVLFTLGPPNSVERLLDKAPLPPACYLHIRPDVMPLVHARYRVRNERAMNRMLLISPSFQHTPTPGALRLGPADAAAVRRLYSDGDATGEAPDFFADAMLDTGVFFGIADGPDLRAVAGTHLVAPEVGVAAVGNIYTRRDSRRRGLAATVTRAVVAELLRRGIPTIALNVNPKNDAAARVYERLGFERYCAFHEGLAESRND